MKLTGKCKEEFYNFLYKKYELNNRLELNRFNEYPESMQYGVYVDFFDSVNIGISINQHDNTYWYDIQSPFNECDELNSRPQARKLAIEKANEIYNKI